MQLDTVDDDVSVCDVKTGRVDKYYMAGFYISRIKKGGGHMPAWVIIVSVLWASFAGWYVFSRKERFEDDVDRFGLDDPDNVKNNSAIPDEVVGRSSRYIIMWWISLLSWLWIIILWVKVLFL